MTASSLRPLLLTILLPLRRSFLFYPRTSLSQYKCITTTRINSYRMQNHEQPPTDKATYFTVCSVCHGQGKLSRPPSKKQRLRHKRARLNDKETIAPLLPRLETCSSCQGSGLQLSNCTTPIDSALPELAIVGGGLAGLALATACRHRGIPHTVYERDVHFQERSQGYGLTMQQASKALKGFGIDSLQDGFTSTKHVVHKHDGTVVGEWGLRKWGRTSDSKPRRQNVHIARQSLRHELYQTAGKDENVRWNHQFLHCTQLQSGRMQLAFQVGDDVVTREADLVVGADGIRSQVRSQLLGDSSTPLRYLDCIVILGICPLSAISVESELLDGETVFQTADGFTRIYMMPFSRNEYMWQLSFPMTQDEASNLSREGPSALKQEAVQRCQLWHSPVPDILLATPTSLISGYPVYDRALLTPQDLQNSSRVTLMGDACHPMSPFKGQGANQALLDALSLARCIYKFHRESKSVDDAVKAFEGEMLERSAIKVKASAEAAQFLHTTVAIQEGNVTRGAAAGREL